MSAEAEDSGVAESRQLNFNEYDDDYYADNGGGDDYYDDRQLQRRTQRMRQRKQLAQRRSLLARRQLAVQKDRTNLAQLPQTILQIFHEGLVGIVSCLHSVNPASGK